MEADMTWECALFCSSRRSSIFNFANFTAAKASSRDKESIPDCRACSDRGTELSFNVGFVLLLLFAGIFVSSRQLIVNGWSSFTWLHTAASNATDISRNGQEVSCSAHRSLLVPIDSAGTSHDKLMKWEAPFINKINSNYFPHKINPPSFFSVKIPDLIHDPISGR